MSLHLFARPDRDSHITIDIKPEYVDDLSEEDLKLWDLGDSNHNKSELSKLATNYDVNSVMQYASHFGFSTLNDFYNKVGFGNGFNLTATDMFSVNLLYSCPDVKKELYKDLIREEVDRNYVELMQLKINPNEASRRSSLLYPPAFLVRTSDPATVSLAGVYTKTIKHERDFRPVYKHKDNQNHIFYEGEV